MTTVYRGITIAKGIAIGQAHIVKKINLELPDYKPEDLEAEVVLFQNCHAATVQETEQMLRDAGTKQIGHAAEILDAQLTLLKDEYSVVEPIKQAVLDNGLNVAQAIERIMRDIEELFSQADDDYIRARANDAEDVRRRLLTHALNVTIQDYSSIPAGTILIAEELTPSDTICMDMAHVCGIVTALGGYYSHVGIISRNLGIPSVCNVKEVVDIVENGTTVIVDGDDGTVKLNIDPADLEFCQEQQMQREKNNVALEKFRHAESMSANGEQGMICANIGSVAEAEVAVAAGAEGIGLLRSEFLYMEQRMLPNEEIQLKTYRKVLEIMGNQPVIIRTLDVGGDKTLPSLPIENEDNPFLGCRAIRLCLRQQDLFKVQLRALLRASVYGNLKIMFPMISSLEELRQAKALLRQAREELEQEGVALSPVEVGIMIETPAAAMIADHLAKEVTFFSIGTNDLIQYTVAAERGNPSVEHLYSPYHPAVLRLIAMTAQAAATAHIVCGMCGEAAADPVLLPVFWGLGLREFSMSASAVAYARKTLSHWTTADCEKLAAQTLSCPSRQDVQYVLQNTEQSKSTSDFL